MLEMQAVMSHLTWVLGTDFGFSRKAEDIMVFSSFYSFVHFYQIAYIKHLYKLRCQGLCGSIAIEMLKPAFLICLFLFAFVFLRQAVPKFTILSQLLEYYTNRYLTTHSKVHAFLYGNFKRN